MAVVCIRAGASGADSGVDWQDAYPSWTAYLAAGTSRSDQPYVADGVYNEAMVGATLSDGSTIVVKKATEADHGVEAGWSAAYGDGQAQFTGGLHFETDGWVIDGKVGGFDGATMPSFFTRDHGFDFEVPITKTGTQVASYGFTGARKNITLKRCAFAFDRLDYYGGENLGAGDASRYSDAFGSVSSTTTGSPVTVTTDSPHGLSNGDRVGFSGLDDDGSDGSGSLDPPDFNDTSKLNSVDSLKSRFVVSNVTSNTFEVTPRSSITQAATMGSWKRVMGGTNLGSMIGSSSDRVSGVTLQHCYLGTSGDTLCQLIYADDVTVEYCALADCFGVDGAGWHQSGISTRRARNLVVRYNAIRNVSGTSIIGAYNDSLVNGDGASYRAENWDVYGNVYYNDDATLLSTGWGFVNRVDTNPSLPALNVRVHQNTIVHITTVGTGSQIKGKTNVGDWQEGSVGCEARNNLIVDSETTAAGGQTVSHFTTANISAINDPDITGAPGHQASTDDRTVWFVDFAGDDLRLAQDTDQRFALGAPYDVDMFGNEITTSRGAVQLNGSPPSPPPDPTAPRRGVYVASGGGLF